MKKPKLKYRVRLGRFGSPVEFVIHAQNQTFALCEDYLATAFDTCVEVEDAIQACPAIKAYGPTIESFISEGAPA